MEAVLRYPPLLFWHCSKTPLHLTLHTSYPLITMKLNLCFLDAYFGHSLTPFKLMKKMRDESNASAAIWKVPDIADAGELWHGCSHTGIWLTTPLQQIRRKPTQLLMSAPNSLLLDGCQLVVLLPFCVWKLSAPKTDYYWLLFCCAPCNWLFCFQADLLFSHNSPWLMGRGWALRFVQLGLFFMP